MVDPWMVWGKDEVWADVIIVLGPGCCGGRMMSGWTLSWFWPVGAEGNGCLGARNHGWVDVIIVLAHGCSE